VCVLVVDDQPVHAGLLQRLLEGFGVEVDVATSGREATEVFAPERHDLVFLDVLMPGMNGVETAAWLRAHVDPDARVPLVAVTGLDADALAGRGGLDRFDDVLAKPIGERAVRDVLRRLLGGVEVPPERAPVQAERAGPPRAEPLRSVPDADPRVVRFRGAGGGGAAPDPRPVADAQAEARVRLVVDDVTVEVPDGFADDTLTRVLRALRRR
jgi:CheY-like chemotaxis protein